jgi:acyl-homoserine-lactone acylase
VELDGDVKAAYGRRMILLDGSDSTFEWVNDRRAGNPGIVPAELAPQLERSDYVFNANDSYWMSHARVPLSGFSPCTAANGRCARCDADERAAARRRVAHRAVGRGWTVLTDEVWKAVFSNRSMSVELLRDALVERCVATSAVTVGDASVPLRTLPRARGVGRHVQPRKPRAVL